MRLEAILLAGGGGERFWPRSRAICPKQFLPLLGEKPMLVVTAERVGPLAARTWVVTRAEWADEARRILPSAEILAEPVGRSTAPALGLVASRVPPETILAALPSDHEVGDASAFRDLLSRAADAASKHDGIVCLGLAPTRPETGYGYIRPGNSIGDGLSRIASFAEKPARARAEELIREGALWNGGIFVFRAGVLLDEIRRHLPDLAKGRARIEAARGTPQEARVLSETYEALSEASIDRGILEKTDRAMVLAAPLAWDDVGDWNALERIGRREGENAVGRGDLLAQDATGIVADTDQGLVAAVGVKDLVIVRDGEIVLVAAKDATGQIRDVLKHLRQDPARRKFL